MVKDVLVFGIFTLEVVELVLLSKFVLDKDELDSDDVEYFMVVDYF